MPRAAVIARALGTVGLAAIVTATAMLAVVSFVMVRLPAWLDLSRRALEVLG